MPSKKVTSDLKNQYTHILPARKLFLAGIFFLLILLPGFLYSQENIQKKQIDNSENLYDTDLLPASFHTERRKLFREKMADHAAAVFIAAPVRNRSNDVDYKYHQNPDFYYYTGYRHPDALLLILKEPVTINGQTANEFIFIQENDEMMETWTGKVPSAEDVRNSSGIRSVAINTGFDSAGINWNQFEKIYLKTAVNLNYNTIEKGSTGWMAAKFKEQTSGISEKVDRAGMLKINSLLREVKTSEEIDLMKKAIDLTCRGFIEVIKAAKPGMTEQQLQTINEYFWYYGGAEYAGYPSIVGGGHNACVLHYEKNRKKLVDGDFVVMDMGAEYHGYTADVTRSFPINGKFSKEQKLLYDLVLKAQEAGISVCKPGTPFNEPHKVATKIIADGLIKLGIIKKEDQVRKYFMHGTSHYLGLDVHDPGTYGPLQPNSVITVEPGIYIKKGSPCDPKWWDIGIRIEDDILITESDPINLSACIPKTTEEIEALMAQESLFNELHKN
ncbi:MAG: aminopeptidase P family protein [Bacteroidia bacterium]|nr:aminopeptidase P family protein [Bacteroidia bacterium]